MIALKARHTERVDVDLIGWRPTVRTSAPSIPCRRFAIAKIRPSGGCRPNVRKAAVNRGGALYA